MLDIDLNKVVDLSVQAGDAVLEVYRSNDISVERKEDRTPLTLADKSSHEVIVNGLETLCPGIPVLSEEGQTIPYKTRKHWDWFWLVDPLDGTKEFINRNGEFTVNIALMDQDEPVLGVVLVPASGVVYFAQKDYGAFKKTGNCEPERILVDKNPPNGMVAVRIVRQLDILVLPDIINPDILCAIIAICIKGDLPTIRRDAESINTTPRQRL